MKTTREILNYYSKVTNACREDEKRMNLKWFSEEKIRKAINKLQQDFILTDYASGSKYGEDWFIKKINNCLTNLFGEEK